jgi:hypothetical protein
MVAAGDITSPLQSVFFLLTKGITEVACCTDAFCSGHSPQSRTRKNTKHNSLRIHSLELQTTNVRVDK